MLIPSVSVITPLFNSAKFINETINSVISQTFTEWEMILVDDCSLDNSVAIAERFAALDSRIRVLRLAKNSGAAVARNTAIEAAQGRYIAFLDSDDLWLPHKLEVQLEFMERNQFAFSYSAYHKIGEDGQDLGMMFVPEKVNYQQLLKCPVIGCLTAIYDSDKLGKVYMPLIRKRQDFGLWLRLLKITESAHGIQQPLAQYRVRSNSISSNKTNAATYTWRLYRDIEKLSLIKSIYYFTNYAVRSIIRHKRSRIAKWLGT